MSYILGFYRRCRHCVSPPVFFHPVSADDPSPPSLSGDRRIPSPPPPPPPLSRLDRRSDWIGSDLIMSCATQLLRHSRKLRHAQNAVQFEPAAIAARCFSSDVAGKIGGEFPVKAKITDYKSNSKGFNIFKISSPGLNRTCTPSVATNMCLPTAGMSLQRASTRSFSTNSDLPPHQEIGMPSLSPTMTEGNIARWLKKEGDKVSPGEVLCEVETDKATVEMECMEEGYIAKILHGDGAKEIKVGEVIVITVEEEGDIEKFKDYSPSASAAPAVEASPEPASPKKEPELDRAPEPKVPNAEETSYAEDRIFSSPLARKLAEDNNVPLSSIKGTGPDGRILKADVEDYLASSAKGVSTKYPKAPAAAQALDHSDLPNSQIRKVTASRLLLSKQTIPHYYLTLDTRVDKLMELRSQLNSLQESSGGKRISINDLVIKAAALALRKVPQCNSSWMNDFIRQYHNVNVSVAVQTEHGLFVPVIRDADKKGLSQIAAEVKHFAQKAKENSLKPEDYEGGTFTISNLGGPFGIKQFCAIINPPQSGILAVGSAEKRVIPGAGPDHYEFGSFMSATLSCDHRVIDGAIGAEWLKAFKGYIENPQSMLL